MQLRRARPDEQDWVNARYEEIGFHGSDLTRDLVIVAELDGKPAGMGRLVPAGEQACELGGMLVFDAFRGRGVARAIIDELLRHANGREVYCIPFSDLEAIYEKAGFRRIEPAGLPEAIERKVDWCRRNIPRDVLVMKLTT